MLGFTFIFQKPDCFGFAMNANKKYCRLSDYAEGIDLIYADNWDAYKVVTDSTLQSTARTGTVVANPHAHPRPESRSLALTDPRSMFW